MAKAKLALKGSIVKPVTVVIDPTECPFREFRDNELQPEFWGMGPAAFRAYSTLTKGAGPPKLPADYTWPDDQAQPLPRSVRNYLHSWVRAEPLALDRWEANVVVFEEENGGKMVIADMQLSHAQVLLRSSFCRRVLSACFMLEKCDTVPIEHQWELFNFTPGPEGWRARNNIYSPGLKAGGGSQHRPGLSRNGCYLVRLYYLGAWRCVWVSDQVPVDATGAPLLPFSPLLGKLPPVKPLVKGASATVITTSTVQLWPLLLCKALLKLAAPDMSADDDASCVEDEEMPYFDILHSLTGAMHVRYPNMEQQALWDLLCAEIPVFCWDDDDETQASTLKSKSTKKTITKDPSSSKSKLSMASIVIEDTKDLPPYHLPGFTPAFEMSLLVMMVRDVPIKKPLPEPEVELWKYYRWVDWARSHGMYEAYDCPRTKFVKVNSLLKLSHAPHLLDVQSTQSITMNFIKADLEKTTTKGEKGTRPVKEAKTTPVPANVPQQTQANTEELREWIPYVPIYDLMKTAYILYYPSILVSASAASSPPIRLSKGGINKAQDVPDPKSAPLYLQVDSAEENILRISLNMLHPNVLSNSGVLTFDEVNPASLILEEFEWFKDSEVPLAKAFIQTSGYDTAEAFFPPGRHFCRVWVYCRMNWHLKILSESTLVLGARDQVQCASTKECVWASRFLLNLGNAFNNWIKLDRSNYNISSILASDKEFFRSYYPDLPWDKAVIGYDRTHLHWMFRQALQNHILKRVPIADLGNVFTVLRNFFRDPDLGFSPKPAPPANLRAIIDSEPCDCMLPEIEEIIDEQSEFITEEQIIVEEKMIADMVDMDLLLRRPVPPATSNVCDLATEEISCGVLKEEREKLVRKHEAATVIQSYWRGTFARNCVSKSMTATADVLKALQDSTFGTQECLSNLMKEFFKLYPGTKYAYSVASALGGVYGLHQHTGTTSVAPKSKWIPYFQGVFYCHTPVKVHFDVSSTLIHHSTVAVYDNDNGKKLPQAYNAHITFNFNPNMHGYTVMGHGSLAESLESYLEVQWQLTVQSSVTDAFHICDNLESCSELPLSSASMLRIEEIFIPNRRNILGGIRLAVTKHECVRFRAAVSSPDLEIVATLREVEPNGELKEITTCSGKGELFWPYVRLEPNEPSTAQETNNHSRLKVTNSRTTVKPTKGKALSGRGTKSGLKLKMEVDPKFYYIEVVCPSGWPLTVAQWKRVDEVRNSPELLKLDSGSKKQPTVKEKATGGKGSAKDKQQSPQPQAYFLPQPGDAFTELECSSAVGGGIIATRDDERQQLFARTRKSWDETDYGRNRRGADIRKIFREENLETPPPPPSESIYSAHLDLMFEGTEEEWDKTRSSEPEPAQGPTPVSESEAMETPEDAEEEILYLTMPDILRDKFVPFDFVPSCTKEITETPCVLVTADIAEAARKNRQARIEAAIVRKQELQEYNEIHVLGRQRNRTILLESLGVDSIWPPALQQVLEERDETIAQEILQRNMSATKKKQQGKQEAPQDRKAKK